MAADDVDDGGWERLPGRLGLRPHERAGWDEFAAALKAKGRTDIRMVGQGGDGGTVDIGMGCLPGMFERGDDVLFICYDNEAYMNTGVQRSGATPPAARTATTPAVGPEPGNAFGPGKSVPLIAMAHEIPYVATATVTDLRDLEYKAARAMGFCGARYLHILVPCPLGWASAPGDTIKVARLAAQSGLFPVFEAEHGETTSVTPIRRRVPVEEYLRIQGRYAHLFRPPGQPGTIARLQAIADRNIARFGLLNHAAGGSGPSGSGVSPGGAVSPRASTAGRIRAGRSRPAADPGAAGEPAAFPRPSAEPNGGKAGR